MAYYSPNNKITNFEILAITEGKKSIFLRIESRIFELQFLGPDIRLLELEEKPNEIKITNQEVKCIIKN